MSYQISTNANSYIFPDSSVFFLKKIHPHMHHTRTYSNPIAYFLWTKKTVQKFSCIKWTSILSQTFSLNLFFLLILMHSFMSLFIIYISSSCTYQYDTYDKCAMKMILILLDFHFLLKIEPMMWYDYFEWILFSMYLNFSTQNIRHQKIQNFQFCCYQNRNMQIEDGEGEFFFGMNWVENCKCNINWT